jgi:hypothetical protein
MKKAIIILLTALLIFPAGLSFAREVPINPITPDIRSKLKESTVLVRNVEDSMGPKVSDLETIYKTYTETCKGKESDRGCVEIQNQIREKYKEVLSTLANELPKVKRSVTNTANELGASLKKKTHGKDLKELYQHVSKKGTMPKVRGPLSKKLGEMLKALGRPSTNVSVLELSLQTQADLVSATEILAFLEAEISRQMVVVDMIQDFGALSPEMASVMKGVAEIFGYDMEFEPMVEEEEGLGGDDWRK